MKTKILIIEDDKALNNGIVLSLNGSEYSFCQAFSIKDAKEKLSPDIGLIILDINLPDGSGLDMCREIRTGSNVPIIFLTANDMEFDIVAGLQGGADDYITKPFSLMVLRARVSAVLRRNTDKNVFTVDDLSLDFDNMEFKKNNIPLELSKTEQKLLKLLIQNRGNTLSRDTLIDRIWSDGSEFVDENALSVTVKRLRDKLETGHIKTIYGIGYTWGN